MITTLFTFTVIMFHYTIRLIKYYPIDVHFEIGTLQSMNYSTSCITTKLLVIVVLLHYQYHTVLVNIILQLLLIE